MDKFILDGLSMTHKGRRTMNIKIRKLIQTVIIALIFIPLEGKVIIYRYFK
jgi:hypothetical protein